MKLLVLVLLVTSAAAQQVDPRGARPVVPNTRSEKCGPQKEWPMCTHAEMDSKCPSGCRIHGLMERVDHNLLKKIEKIRGVLEDNMAKHRNTDQESKKTHNALRERLTVSTGQENDFFDMAQTLRMKITEMKIKIDHQLQVLGALKEKVRDQVNDMHRLEVDIDMKLRSCKGSCKTYHTHEVDHEGHVELGKQMHQLDTLSGQTVENVATLHVMKRRPLKDAVVDNVFKSGNVHTAAQTTETTEDLFPSVNTMQLFLEVEGSSSSSPATVSKVPGTSLSPDPSSSSGSSPSSSGSSPSSITELVGGGSDPFGTGLESLGQPAAATKSTSCTRRWRQVVVDTGDGPVTKTEEYVEGGPECQALGTKTAHLASSKGSLADSKTSFVDIKTSFADPFANPFANTGIDLGAFLTDTAEEDVPDVQARSVKSARVERRADYVGKDCVAARRFHLSGESNGVFTIRPSPSSPAVPVFCQQEGLMGGWLLAQQRESGSLGFNRSWAEYRAGFGAVDAAGNGEFWLGNENLHLLTSQGETMLRAELEDWEGGVAGAEYTVKVGSEAEGYALHVSGYAGEAGDALAAHNGMKFSTYDRDNDNDGDGSCALAHGAGWWFDRCHAANPNGVYRRGPYEVTDGVADGVVWSTYKPRSYSLKRARMFIRAAAF